MRSWPGSIPSCGGWSGPPGSATSQIAWKSGREQDAEAFLREALALADRFDAAPNYRADALRWYEGPDTAMAYDSMGATARAAVRQVFTQQGEDPEAGAFLTAFESEN